MFYIDGFNEVLNIATNILNRKQVKLFKVTFCEVMPRSAWVDEKMETLTKGLGKPVKQKHPGGTTWAWQVKVEKSYLRWINMDREVWNSGRVGNIGSMSVWNEPSFWLG